MMNLGVRAAAKGCNAIANVKGSLDVSQESIVRTQTKVFVPGFDRVTPTPTCRRINIGRVTLPETSLAAMVL
jgi:hypothetical protein